MVQQQKDELKIVDTTDVGEPQSLLIDISSSSNTDRSISELEQSVKQMSIKGLIFLQQKKCEP